MAPWTKDRLAQHVESGAAVDFLFFWGHTPKQPPQIDASCLSQWFARPFTVGGVTYPSAEHFMMAEKARLFADEGAEARILAVASPAEVKAIGREVNGYNDAAWAAARFDAVVRGNVGKFGEHPDLRAFLLGTGERVLVEAAPRDQVWGIGLGASNPMARQPLQWRGQNLLGFALMEVRRLAREQPA